MNKIFIFMLQSSLILGQKCTLGDTKLSSAIIIFKLYCVCGACMQVKGQVALWVLGLQPRSSGLVAAHMVPAKARMFPEVLELQAVVSHPM